MWRGGGGGANVEYQIQEMPFGHGFFTKKYSCLLLVVQNTNLPYFYNFQILKLPKIFHLKGTKRQYSGQMSQIFKTIKTIEIHSVSQTEVCKCI